MTFEELVNETGYWISFEQVSVPRSEGVNLRFIVNKAKESWELLVHPHPDAGVTTYQIDFPNYITFLVAVEDYTRWNDDEKFKGDAFRIYETSTFMDFLVKEWAVEEVNNPMSMEGVKPTVYALACHEHFVYIVSYYDPVVKVISSTNERKTTMTNTTVTTKMRIDRSVEEVFEAIAEPEKMGGYWFSSGTSRIEQGKKITWKYDEYNATGDIFVKLVEENKKIVFSWGPEDGETQVTMTFHTADEGGTIVEVNEAGLKANDPDIVAKMMGQKEGWVYMLTCMKGYLENGITTLRASLIH